VRLQSRLMGAFLAVAALALASAFLSVWQVRRLGSALYEVGVVRLPSLQGLMQMRGAQRELETSRFALDEGSLDALARERVLARIAKARADYQQGRDRYAPLPQTPEERATWERFLPVESRWTARLDSLVAAGEQLDSLAAPGARDSRARAADRQGATTGEWRAVLLRLNRALDDDGRQVDSLVTQLERINVAIAESAKANTIASRDDLQSVLLASFAVAVLAVAAAVGLALRMSRRLSEPMAHVARALSDVSRGRTPARVAEHGDEEVRSLSRAVNVMVDTLHESEARFRSALLHSPIGIAIVAPDGRWLEVNPALCAITGRDRDAMLGMSITDLTHPDDIAVDLAHLREAIEGTRDAWEREKRYVRPDGSVVWIHLNTCAVRRDDGSVLHFVSQVQDITARREASEALRARNERHARYEAAMATLTRVEIQDAEELPELLEDIARVVAVALDASSAAIWRFEEAPASLTLMAGYPPRASGTPPPVLDMQRYPDLFERQFVQHEVFAANDPANDPAMRRFYEEVLQPIGVKAYLRAHVRSRGRIIGNLVATEAREVRTWTTDEASFLLSAANLVSARMAQADLLRAQAEMRQVDKLNAIGQLAGGIAHDFNNLLTVINGCADLLAMSDGDDPGLREELVGAIRDAGSRAGILTRQLLLFSRKGAVHPRVVQVNAALQSIVPLLRRLIGEQVVIRVHPDEELRPVVIDPGQLEQVIVNIAVNARDAMPNGGELAISTANVVYDDAWCREHPDHRPGAFVRLTMSDTGIGMSPDVVARIFEPFFTTKEAGRGTGLGLATVYGIVTQANGFVTMP
jgi:PAS domain S-box-containing protein